MPTRTFLALDIDDCIRGRLAEAKRRIGDSGAKITWVAPENLHVTLNFLGDVADEMLAEVCELAAGAAAKIEPFEFHVHGVLCVPPRAGPLKMFWAGVQDPTGRVAKLHEELDAALAGLGLRAEERNFKPHITLARVKVAKDPLAVRAAAQAYAAEDFGAQRADELITYGSQLTPGGPIYTPIARARLGG